MSTEPRRSRKLPVVTSSARFASPLAEVRLAVTGAEGFLGRHFVEHARAGGAEVLPFVTVADALADPTRLQGDALVHLADRADADSALAALLRAAAGRVARFVHVSSVEVYGFPPDLPVTEAHPFRPATEHSASTVRAEQLVTRLAAELALPFVIVRPTITYGPGDRNGLIDQLVTLIDQHRYLVVGRGDNPLHHTHVDDFVHGLALAVTSPAALNEDFILCGPETTTLKQLSHQVADLRGRWLPPFQLPLPLARRAASAIERIAAARLLKREPPLTQEKLDVVCRPLFFDGGKARRLLGFVPVVGYREGLARTVGARA